MAAVRFPEYRAYEAARIDASNAMMGLLAGAQMAAHLLQLTEGSSRLLPEIYPRIAHIGRFNLTSQGASQILTSAEEHLGTMAVPYALAIHEDHLRTCLRLLVQAGRAKSGDPGAKLFSLHSKFEVATGGHLSAVGLEQFHMVRHLRNAAVHSGGTADTNVISQAAKWSAQANLDWIRIAKRSPTNLRVGDKVRLGHGELLVSLAITKRLTNEMNALMVPALTTAAWSDIVVADLIQTSGIPRARQERLKAAKGLARYHYSPCSLTDHDLTQALARAGHPHI